MYNPDPITCWNLSSKEDEQYGVLAVYNFVAANNALRIYNYGKLQYYCLC